MKINLLRNSKQVLSGHTNIDPFAAGDDSRVIGDLTNLDKFVDDGEAKTIVAEDILDYLDGQATERALKNWFAKLAYGGTIVIGGTDLLEVAKAVANRSLSVRDANAIIHGDNTGGAWASKRQNGSIDLVVDMLQKCGLKVLKKRVHEFRYAVEAERPHVRG